MPNHLSHPPTLLIPIRAASYHIPLQPPYMLWFWGFFLFCLGLLRASHRFLTNTQTLVCGSGESKPQKSPRRRGNAGHMFLWGHSAKISIQLFKTCQVVIWKDVKTVYKKKKKKPNQKTNSVVQVIVTWNNLYYKTLNQVINSHSKLTDKP